MKDSWISVFTGNSSLECSSIFFSLEEIMGFSSFLFFFVEVQKSNEKKLDLSPVLGVLRMMTGSDFFADA